MTLSRSPSTVARSLTTARRDDTGARPSEVRHPIGNLAAPSYGGRKGTEYLLSHYRFTFSITRRYGILRSLKARRATKLRAASSAPT